MNVRRAAAVVVLAGMACSSTLETTIFTWTTADPLSLGVQAASDFRIQASPTTVAFVLANAAGWSITFPTGSRLSPSPACATG